nr:hypothetical protein [Tanacetum cinerariifolium]
MRLSHERVEICFASYLGKYFEYILGIGYNCGYLLKRRKVLVVPEMPKNNLSRNVNALPLEILKLKRRVKKLEKKRISKSLGLKRLRKVGTSQRVESSTKTVVGALEDASKQKRKIAAIDADMEITLADMENQADLGVELQGRKDDDNAAIKDAGAAKPTVFDDEEVTMTMAQTLIKMKAEKARLLDEQMAKRLHDEEVEQAAAREKQEKVDLENAKKHLNNIRKYQSLKRKPISIAQARKNMIVYLKNMAGYKMEHFRGMTYDKVRPIFEKEYNKVQTLFKHDKDKEPQKKRVAEKTLLHESFKKLKAVEVLGSHSTQDTPTNYPKEMSEEDVKNMLKIVLVSKFKVEALHVKENYPMSNAVMIMMLSAKLQVEVDSEMARDLVMKIFIEANKPKSRTGVDVVQRLEEKALKE